MVNGCKSSARSPNVGNSNNVYNVNTSGALNNNNANNSYGVAPDCIKDKSLPEKVSSQVLSEGQKSEHLCKESLTIPFKRGRKQAADARYSLEWFKRLYTAASFSKYEQAISFSSLYRAALTCSRGVSWKGSVQDFRRNLLVRTFLLRKSLINGTYRILPYIKFTIYEPKKREIVSTRFRDRVFQRALCDNGLYEEITRSFIYENCACLKGRGTDYALNIFKKHLHKFFHKHRRDGYILKLDVKKFFPSIPHCTAKKTLDKRIKDVGFLLRMYEIIDSFDEDSRSEQELATDPFGKRGLSLGSQVSQLIALAVLDDLDHYIKEELKIKHYVRYMDDMVLIHPDKEYLKRCWKRIEEKINAIGLSLNKKSCMFPIRQGVIFLQQRFILTDTGKVVTRASNKNKRHEMRKLRGLKRVYDRGEIKAKGIMDHFQSWQAHAQRSKSYNLINYMWKFGHQLFHGETK